MHPVARWYHLTGSVYQVWCLCLLVCPIYALCVQRVFAVSAVLSSVLIYNLPETIRESDISKLSFAVELANGLYERYSPAEGKLTVWYATYMHF